MARESVFQRRLIKKLEERGAYVVNIWGNGFMKAGIPDLLVCYKGHFLGLELKTDTGKPSELQLAHLKMIHEAGGMSMLLRPSIVDALWLELDMIDEREVTTRTHEN